MSLNFEPAVAIVNPVPPGRSTLQQFDEGAFHRWYNFVLGYSDRLVRHIFERLDVSPGAVVLDPFCGSGTTLIEAAKWKVDSIGVDANPFSIFAANTKASFSLDPRALLGAAARVEDRYLASLSRRKSFKNDDTYSYLNASGMIGRGWISPRPLHKALALRDGIQRGIFPSLKDALLLALLADLPHNIGNMRFGPQIYRGPIKHDADVLQLFRDRVATMVRDLSGSPERAEYRVPKIVLGDSRAMKPVLRTQFGEDIPLVDFVICSPPYPTEHDYTRHTRLELAFTDNVSSRNCVREIKRAMIRSHTKGIYVDDSDADRGRGIKSIDDVVALVETAIVGRDSGFEKLYPTVVRSYFGGMKRHFGSVFRLMRPGGKAAYVVGDQAAYMRVPVRTAELLGEVAQSVGFRVDQISVWRQRWATNMSSYLNENILFLSKPN